MIGVGIILMLLVTVRTWGCPIMCICRDYPRDRVTTLHYTAVSCNGFSGGNITNNLNNSTRELQVNYLSDVEVAELVENLAELPSLISVAISKSVVENVTTNLEGLQTVQSLSLAENQLKYFPEAFSNLSNLMTLDLSNNLIAVLNSNSFCTLRTLEVLNLSVNSLTTINSDSFMGLTSLKCLDLSENNLTSLSDKVLLPLSALQYLNLSSNRLEVLNEASFISLVKLRQLDVSWNRLARVAPGSLQLPSLARLLLAGNPNLGGSREAAVLVGTGRRLQTVDASRTGLKQVPAALTHSIRTLRLAGNSIRSVSCGDLDSYPLLQLLDFTSNELEFIEDDALGRLDSLTILYLSDNKIREIPKSLPELLKVLHLERNSLKMLGNGDLLGLAALEVLLLNDNKISAVAEAAFSPLLSLVTLDMSRNPISVLQPGCLAGPTALQVLRLSSINVIPAAKEVSFPLSTPEHLITLDLSGSAGLARQLLADTAALAAAKQLQELDISRAGIQFIRSDLLHYLPQLRVLHVKDNPLNCSELNWLGSWMRRQDVHEYRQIGCSSPADYWGILLIDLPELETNYKEDEAILTTNYETTTERGEDTMKYNIISANNNETNNLTFAHKIDEKIKGQINKKSSILTENTIQEEYKNNTKYPNKYKTIEKTAKSEDNKETTDDIRRLVKKIYQNSTLLDLQHNNTIDLGEKLMQDSEKLNLTHKKYLETLEEKINNKLNTTIIKNEPPTISPEMSTGTAIFSYTKPLHPSLYTKTSPTLDINVTPKKKIDNHAITGSTAQLLPEIFLELSPETNITSNLPIENLTVTSTEKQHQTIDYNITKSPSKGEMSMYTTANENINLFHPGMVILAVGILGAGAAMIMLTTKFTRRRRNSRLFQHEDIEVNNLPGVTELW